MVNLTQSGFNDGRAKWILGGKGMLWFSNRDGLKAVAQGGGAQQDVYGMFFTQDAWDRFKLTKEEMALVKEAEEKKDSKDNKEKADASRDKKDVAAKDKEKIEDLDDRLRRREPAQGAVDHPLLVTRRRPGEQGRRYAATTWHASRKA